MAMKKVSANATEKFESQIGDSLVMNVTKTTSAKNVTLHARVKKGDDEVATVSYDADGGYLIIDLRKFRTMTKAEVEGVLATVKDDILGEVYPSEDESAE